MELVPRATIISVLLFSLLCFESTCTALPAPSTHQPVRKRTGATDFIKASCSATRYPALCVQSLSVYARAIRKSSKQLAQAALSVSLGRARSASAYVSKMSGAKGMRPRDHAAMKDCVENMGDSIDRLARSIRELGRTGRARSGSFLWHVSNVQTWVSAALTDENTCMDGFAGPAMSRNMRAAVRRRVVNVAQVTSNALALVNRYAKRP